MRRVLRRVPAACVACAAIAFGHAVVWAVVTPVFQVPDEVSHVGYAQYVAETGKLPKSSAFGYSGEQATAVQGLPFNIETRPSWYRGDRRALLRQLDSGRLSRSSAGAAGTSVNYPPLYYGLEAIPYRIAYGANFLDRIFFMRLLSALMAALTVAFVFLFLRELLPRTPWAWTVGALGVAFQPVFAFLGGGVTPDNLLFTASAALIWLIARAFRRGLTPGLGLAIGVAAVAGLLTKQTMFGMGPGVALGMLLLVWRAPPERRREAWQGLLAAGLVVAVPYALWLLASYELFDRTATSATAGFTNAKVVGQITWKGQLFYIWQVLFPRLPGMQDQTPYYIFWDVYIKGFIGRFGWFEFGFEPWVYWLGLGILASWVALAGAALVRGREALRARWAEALTYVVITAGMFVFIEVAAYRYRSSSGQFFEQTRYMFPLLAFYGAILALAAKGAGRRWGPAVGAFIVVLAMGHSLFSIFLSLGRWYA